MKKGLRTWKNQSNGFSVFELHFKADPEKATEAWIAESKIGMSKDKWNREFDLKWTRTSGKAVYGDEFNRAMHIPSEDLKPAPMVDIYRGWDFGLSQTVTFAQVQDNRLVVLAELVAGDYYPEDKRVGTIRTVPLVEEFCAKHFPGFRFVDIIDPSGTRKAESDETSCIDIMKKAGLRPKLGPKAFEERRSAVISLLSANHRGRPRLLVNPSCERIIDGFTGAYYYPDKATSRTSYRIDMPVKTHPYSDLHDGLQYVAWYFLNQRQKDARRLQANAIMKGIPSNTYGLSDET